MSEAPDAGIEHRPVMLDEMIEALALEPGNTVVDGTAGRGGHAEAVARAIGSGGTLVLMDLDERNLEFAADRVSKLAQAPRVEAVHANFTEAAQVLKSKSLRADAFLADLGFASNQMGDPARGFSFSSPGPLDMRLNQGGGESAQALLARVSEKELADLIYQLGEDPFSRRIAKRIIYVRDLGLLKNTADLARAVVEAYGGKARQSRMHPATRTFMALRIAVNKELESLELLLSMFQREISSFFPSDPGVLQDPTARLSGSKSRTKFAPERAGEQGLPAGWLSKNARLAILAFHSLEDRLMKRAFVDWERHGWVTRLARKPLVAGDEECAANPRARSAKLRSVRVAGA